MDALKVCLLQLLIWTLVNQGLGQFSRSNGNTSGGDIRQPMPKRTSESVTAQCCNTVYVHCSDPFQQVRVLSGFCMTNWSAMNTPIVGRCPYNNYIQKRHLAYHLSGNLTTNFMGNLTINLMSNSMNNMSMHDDSMCGPLHRKGLLCGKCKKGFLPAVFSFTYSCIDCTDGAKNWVIFLSVTLLPTTIFFLLVMVFRVNAFAPPLSAFVLLAHIACSSNTVLRFMGYSDSLSVHTAYKVPLDILFTIYGVWNLDFLRAVIPPYCLPGVNSSMQALAMKYVVAFYPLILVAFAYLCISMHHYNIRPVVALWRPFHRLFVRAKRSWDPNASIINTFATFLLLSYWKLTHVSFQLLATTEIYSCSGSKHKSHRFYYDASQKLFHGDHLPFALLAITIIATFVVLPPIVLCLYPTRLFRKFLWCIRIRGHGMVAFMDVFQGSYKDGTDGTRDWRFMSGAYFILRIFAAAAHHILPTTTDIPSTFLLGSCFILWALVVSVVKPYKQYAHSIADSLLLADIGLIVFMALAARVETLLFVNNSPMVLALCIIGVFVPLLLIGGFACFAIKRKYFPKKDIEYTLLRDV